MADLARAVPSIALLAIVKVKPDPGLLSDITVAVFQAVGNTPGNKIRLKRPKGVVSDWQQICRIRLGSWNRLD